MWGGTIFKGTLAEWKYHVSQIENMKHISIFINDRVYE